ncbi:hypothetical protein KDA14_03485, partial [Candidatus Saccharibacteria bacterium]|nr:hypothetical protein [Candidatus Saccharibacteria bacterium]
MKRVTLLRAETKMLVHRAISWRKAAPFRALASRAKQMGLQALPVAERTRSVGRTIGRRLIVSTAVKTVLTLRKYGSFCILSTQQTWHRIITLSRGIALFLLWLYRSVFSAYMAIVRRYLRPWRAALIAKYPLLQRWDAWKFRTAARRTFSGAFMLLVLGVFYHATLFAAPDLSDLWDLNTPADYTASSGVELTGGVARLKAQNYSSDAQTAALYHFDEAGGTNITDSSSNSNDGTLSGGSFVTGNLNNAVSLDGVSDGIVVPNSAPLQLGQTQSIEAWTKFASPFNNASDDRRNQIVDKGDYQLYYN